jgi:hypothetical protein
MTSLIVNRDVIEPIIKNMEMSLSQLAMHWRSSDNDENAREIVQNYQAILRCMIALGFEQSLLVEAELPDDLMPQEYLDLFD